MPGLGSLAVCSVFQQPARPQRPHGTIKVCPANRLKRFSHHSTHHLRKLGSVFLSGYAANLLRPVFAHPRAWLLIEGGFALVMYAIASKLILTGGTQSVALERQTFR